MTAVVDRKSISPLGHTPNQKKTFDRPHPVRLLPGLYQVGGGFYSHSRDACSYLIVNESNGECILIDSGSHSGYEALRANFDMVADIKQLKLVIGTHCHWDHVEAFGHLCHETTAKFALHTLDAEAVRTGDPELTCAGFLYNEPFHPFPVDLELNGGETYEMGDYRLEILHLPGHTPGCIGVKLEFSRTNQVIFIPGDSVQGAFSKRINSSMSTWKRSMRRLMLQKFDFMLPNHLPNGAQTALLSDVDNRLARQYSQLQTNFQSFMDKQWN
ncbi:MAG: Beta-lactamase domain protein [Chloroflexi bacterium]|jgi:hydroxyacylglutathione hydrolase|nr:Beta-lactamase domain protein [Chloroflexota bacterium]